jgi:hypothetical protein
MKSISKICLTVALAASVTACTWDSAMYDSDMHHNMKRSTTYNGYSMGPYDYPPYTGHCPADHRMKGWC